MDNDSQMITLMSKALIDLQVKYRERDITDRMQIKPALEELLRDFTQFQIKLLKEGIITTQEDLDEMTKIKNEVDAAVNMQKLLSSIARTIGFIAVKI